MASVAACCDTDFIREQFARVPEVQSVHLFLRDSTCHITAAVPVKNYALEDALYDIQYAIMDRLPDFLVDLNIVVLNGRDLQEIVTDIGSPLIQRAA